MKPNISVAKCNGLLVLVFLALLLPGCGRPGDALNNSTQSTNISANTIITFTGLTNKTLIKQDIESLAEDDFGNLLQEETGKFNEILRTETIINDVLNATNKLTHESISNALYSLGTESIARKLVHTEFNREKPEVRDYNFMLIHEEVMRRKTPPWTYLLSLRKLLDFYSYNSYNFGHEDADRILSISRHVTLSDNPSKSESRTYVALQIDLAFTRLPDEEKLERMDYIEKAAKEGTLEFPEQPLEILPLFRACTLIALGRDKEATRIVQELYDRRDSIKDWSTRHEIENGVESFIKLQMSSYPDLYPEMSNFSPTIK